MLARGVLAGILYRTTERPAHQPLFYQCWVHGTTDGTAYCNRRKIQFD
jgi:hypothetical protein